MTLLEILVIYLAISAPFGAHYYLTRGAGAQNAWLLLRAAAVAVGWFVYAAFLLREQIENSSRKRQNNGAADKTVDALAQDLAATADQLLAKSRALTFFEFRETLERYVGLTATINDAEFEPQSIAPREKEIFRVAGRGKKEQQIGALIVKRRNSHRLRAHQTTARADLARAIEIVCKSASAVETESLRRRFERDVSSLARLLNDASGVEAFEKAAAVRQSSAPEFVEKALQPEQKIWKPEPKKRQFPALQTASAPLKPIKD